MGAEVDLDVVPLREADMEPFEILTSESQERMLAQHRPSLEARGRAGTVRPVGAAHGGDRHPRRGRQPDDPSSRRGHRRGPCALAGRQRPAGVPATDRRARARRGRAHRRSTPFEEDLGERSARSSPPPASLQGVGCRQYDRMSRATRGGSGSDAAVIRVPGTMKGVAVSGDGNGRYGRSTRTRGDARRGAGGRERRGDRARPLAITNCLNFGIRNGPRSCGSSPSRSAACETRARGPACR